MKNNMQSYHEMLEEAYKKIKPITISKSSERFEIPKASSQIIGNKTIIANFLQICSYLRRDCQQVAKFLARELAAFSKIESERLVLNRKIQNYQINEKIELYVKEFVICKECKKPDTEIIKQGDYYFIHCLACGAKHSAKLKL
ncbi:MAG: translation initiation factor IF-2 subunit beta [Candidatus Pacearchaeota archaeon]